MKNIKIQIEISDKYVIALIKAKGYEVEMHDFGRFVTEYHNKPVWREAIESGVKINGSWYELADAIKLLYGNSINEHIQLLIEQNGF